MRGHQPKQASMLCLLNVEEQIPADHPLREVKKITDEALGRMSRTFDRMYSKTGRPSIPPERLLKGMVLMALHSIPSEVRFCEQLRYNMLFRWFLDMDMVEEPFDHCAFSDNRDRLLEHDVTRKFFKHVFAEAQHRQLTSKDHFSVDGTLIDAWASMKSFRPKDEDDDDHDNNGYADFKGTKRSNETHESKTDPEAKLMRKGWGKEAKLSFAVHALMENRNGLLADFRVSEANGRCEPAVALEMLRQLPQRAKRRTVGADKGYDNKGFVAGCRKLGVTPHVAQVVKGKGQRGSAITRVTVQHSGYTASQRVRKRIEQAFGWMKTTACHRKTRVHGIANTQLFTYIVGAAYNLIRIARLTPLTA
jgi:transposase